MINGLIEIRIFKGFNLASDNPNSRSHQEAAHLSRTRQLAILVRQLILLSLAGFRLPRFLFFVCPCSRLRVPFITPS